MSVVGLVIVVLSATSPARAAGSHRTYALVIGNNAAPVGEPALKSLRYADDDAVRFFELFSRLGTTRLLSVLDASTQRRYPGLASVARRPTLAALRHTVSELATALNRDKQRGHTTTLYVFFSGHGARSPDGSAYLALTDHDLTRVGLQYEIISKLRATYVHVIIDACHAGGVIGGRGNFFAKESTAQSETIDARQLEAMVASRSGLQPNVGYLVATSQGQEAYEWSQHESGVFTHELLSGLLGPADINGDLRIEYTELEAFVASANRRVSNPQAVPTMIAHPPARDLNASIVDLNHIPRKRLLRGVVADLGHFYIERTNGQRYLDAHLVPGSRMTVLLPQDPVAYLRTAAREVAIAGVTDVTARSLKFRPRGTRSRGAIEHELRRALFSSPYGKDYYIGFVDSASRIGVRFPSDTLSVAVMATPRRRGRFWGAVGVTSVAAATAVTTTILALRAKHDFDTTDLQGPARDAQRRYDRYRIASLISGGVTVVGVAASWWLWPSARVQVAPVAFGEVRGALVSYRW